jgi:hypothetical protein|tara:strand:- start:221 stop:322 length:102 start_codon:yes stop_codon:yes gene_type:complete
MYKKKKKMNTRQKAASRLFKAMGKKPKKEKRGY